MSSCSFACTGICVFGSVGRYEPKRRNPGSRGLVGAPGTGRAPHFPPPCCVCSVLRRGNTPFAERRPRGPAASAVLRLSPFQTPARTRRYGHQDGQGKGRDTRSVFRRAAEATGRWRSFAARPGEALTSAGTTEALSKRHVPAPAAAPSPRPGRTASNARQGAQPRPRPRPLLRGGALPRAFPASAPPSPRPVPSRRATSFAHRGRK